MAEGDRHMYLRLQHWLPVITMDANGSKSNEENETEATDKNETEAIDESFSISSSRPNSGTLMCWRDMGSTFVVNHQDPSYENDDTYEKSSPLAEKLPGSRFEHLLTEHFSAQGLFHQPELPTGN